LGELEGAIIRMASLPLGGADGGYYPDGIPPPLGELEGAAILFITFSFSFYCICIMDL